MVQNVSKLIKNIVPKLNSFYLLKLTKKNSKSLMDIELNIEYISFAAAEADPAEVQLPCLRSTLSNRKCLQIRFGTGRTDCFQEDN